ncbi:MAG: two-component system response regulator [Desulfuromonadales bacterium C00003096]|nr:MAG: two-component system response regulator [Desulfuromonadales bacterium C00003096]
MHLLIVDDEKNIRQLYAADLQDAGYEVETAEDTTTAVELLNRYTFDLVVLDIHMGNESGLDILQDIVQKKKDLPVILCSAYSCYKEDFSSWLADGYVVKSSDTSTLKAEIERVLAKRSSKTTGENA